MKDAGINVKSTHRSMSIDRLLDELIQYRLRHAEILKMIQQKDWYFEDPPEYLKEIKKFFERKLKEIDSELQGLFLQNEQVTCPKCETDMTEKDNELFRTRGSRMNHCNECGSRLERKEVKASKGRSKPRLDDRI
jgi:hypothetical protein